MLRTPPCYRIIRYGLAWAALCSAPLLQADAPPEDVPMKAIHIDIDGTPGTAFDARWTIHHEGETYTYHEPDGRVPQNLRFEGSGIEGQVELLSDGRLDVTVIKGGNHSRSSTGGKGSRLQINVQ